MTLFKQYSMTLSIPTSQHPRKYMGKVLSTTNRLSKPTEQLKLQ
jgi:hypothetical protein